MNKKINEKIYIPLDKGNIDKFYNNNNELKYGYFKINFPLTVFDNQTYTVQLQEESEDKERIEDEENNEEEEENGDE